MPPFPFHLPSPVLEQGHLSVPTHSPGHNGVQGMVGPKAVQPPTASQPCPAHGVPGRKRASRLGWCQGPSVHPITLIKALYCFPRFSTTALHLFWGYGFSGGGDSSEDDVCHYPCPTISHREAGRGWMHPGPHGFSVSMVLCLQPGTPALTEPVCPRGRCTHSGSPSCTA